MWLLIQYLRLNLIILIPHVELLPLPRSHFKAEPLLKVSATPNKIDIEKEHEDNKGFTEEQQNIRSKDDDFFILKLRAAHGKFNLKDEDPHQENNYSFSSGSTLRSSFDPKLDYAHTNFSHSENSKEKSSNKQCLGKKFVSFSQFPLSLCNNLGYLKISFLTKFIIFW